MFLDALLGLLAKSISILHKPIYVGNISLNFLPDKCKIYTLEDGSVHIVAQKESAIWFGMGFAMARDRFFQLEWMRRIATGTLAEILPEAEFSDRIARTIGFHRQSIQWNSVPREEVDYLQNFVDGINAYLKEWYLISKPVEMTLLAIPNPREWTIDDLMCLQRMVAFHFGKNPIIKLLNVLLTQTLLPALELCSQKYERKIGRMNKDYMSDLQKDWDMHTNQNDDRTRNPSASSHYHSDDLADMSIDAETLQFVNNIDWEFLRSLTQYLPSSIGDQCSNAFVINGDHTLSGKPILACDIWGASSVPSLWYKCRVTLSTAGKGLKRADDFDSSGFSIIGLPYLLVGHNQHTSWCITPAQFTDTIDLFVERVDPSDNSKYQIGGRWIYATTIDETIVVRGQKEVVTERVRVTANGPIISNLFTPNSEEGKGKDISISTSALKEWDCIPISGFRRFCSAKRGYDILSASDDIKYFPFVITFADQANYTGWILVEGKKRRTSMLDSIFPLKGYNEGGSTYPEGNSRVGSGGKLLQVYPPNEHSKVHGGEIGRTFVIGTHSFPRCNAFAQERLQDNNIFASSDPFVGHAFKLPTRVRSIQHQLRVKLEVEERTGTIARDQATYRGSCEEVHHAIRISDWNTLFSNDDGEVDIRTEWLRLRGKLGRLSQDEVREIQSREWLDPTVYIRLLSKLLNFDVSLAVFENSRSVHSLPDDITQEHIIESQKIMLTWDGSLNEHSHGSILIQVFFSQLFELTLAPLLSTKEKKGEETAEFILLSKFGFLDTISPLSYSGFDESYFEFLMLLYPPPSDLIINAIARAIMSLRKLKPNAKSISGVSEMYQYTMGLAYKLTWNHYLPHKICKQLNINTKKSSGMMALDIESGVCNTTTTSNYLAFAPNISPKPFQRHTASVLSFIIDMNCPEESEYRFGPGNGGYYGTKFYKNLRKKYTNRMYMKMQIPNNKSSRLNLLPTRRIISRLESEHTLEVNDEETDERQEEMSESPLVNADSHSAL